MNISSVSIFVNFSASAYVIACCCFNVALFISLLRNQRVCCLWPGQRQFGTVSTSAPPQWQQSRTHVAGTANTFLGYA